MLIMLADHVREYFYLHRQVSDPMDIETTEPALFLARLAAHLCPSVFIFLSGVSVCLYGVRHRACASMLTRHLLSRGVFLILLEVLIVNVAWTFQFPPEMLYLQVIWAIGISMVVLAVFIRLPLPLPLIVFSGLLIVFGHNALAGIDFSGDSPWFVPWAILHDRSIIELGNGISARTSYPVLPWIGVMLLGYAAGHWFLQPRSAAQENVILSTAGAACLGAFFLLRYFNLYGDSQPWAVYPTATQTVMSFFNVTKYPASLLFLLLTLGTAAFLFIALRRIELKNAAWLNWLTVFGKAPLLFYILHLYLLHIFYKAALAVYGANHGDRYGFDGIGANWLFAALLVPLFYYACKSFIAYKQKHRNRWLKYL